MSTSAQRRKRRQESRPRRQAADGPPEPDLDLLPAGVAAAGRAARPIASRRRGAARQARRPDAPDEERELMDLYPQPRDGGRSRIRSSPAGRARVLATAGGGRRPITALR